MNNKIIFLDVDGTTCMPGTAISKLNTYAIKQARKNGHLVYFCTGRSLCCLGQDVKDIGYDGLILCAGGYVESNGVVISESSVDTQIVRLIKKALEEHNIAYGFESKTCTYVTEDLANAFIGGKRDLSQEQYDQLIIETNKSFCPEAMSNWDGQGIQKICFGTTNLEAILKIGKDFEQYVTVIEHAVFSSDYHCGEIIVHDTNKATGIAHVLKDIGRTTKDTIGVGDSMNDYPMLALVEYPIAIKHAPDEIKNICKMIARDCKDDALYHIFQSLGLI